VRFGDIGDEAARSADDADLPLDLAAVRADDDLIEALSAGLVPPPSGPRDPSDVEGELVALLAGWVADVRPESLLHPPGSHPAAVQVMDSRTPDEDEPLVAVGSPAPVRSLLEYEDAEPVAITRSRPSGARAYLLRAAAGLAAVALIGSGVVVRSYDSHPGDSLWVVAKVVFPEKSRSVEAATVVSTALNTARVALESGRIDEARAAFQTVQDQLAAVDDADGRAELAHQRDYLTTQLSGPAHNAAERVVAPTAGPQLATGQVGATIPSSPSVTPGATQALLVPTSSSSSSVLAAPSGDPSATASGSGGPSSAAADGSSAPAVVAAPAPDPGVSAPPAASEPAPSDAASGSSAESPPVASPPPADPVTNPPAARAEPGAARSHFAARGPGHPRAVRARAARRQRRGRGRRFRQLRQQLPRHRAERPAERRVQRPVGRLRRRRGQQVLRRLLAELVRQLLRRRLVGRGLVEWGLVEWGLVGWGLGQLLRRFVGRGLGWRLRRRFGRRSGEHGEQRRRRGDFPGRGRGDRGRRARGVHARRGLPAWWPAPPAPDRRSGRSHHRPA
jgi:hypothetical protein